MTQTQNPAILTKRFQTLETLKQKATMHIKNKKFSWAMVYLCDALKETQKIIDTIEQQKQMEYLISSIKVPCHKNLSLCYLKQGNNEGCIQECKEVLNIEPNCVKILYRIATAQMNLRKIQQAEQNLRRAFLIDPNEKQVMKSLERIQINKQMQTKNNSQNNQNTNLESSITVSKIAKYLFFWPILLFLYVWAIFTRLLREKVLKK